MPVVLDPDCYDVWLDPGMHDGRGVRYGDCRWDRSLAQQLLFASRGWGRLVLYVKTSVGIVSFLPGVLMLMLIVWRHRAFNVFLPRWRGPGPRHLELGKVDVGPSYRTKSNDHTADCWCVWIVGVIGILGQPSRLRCSHAARPSCGSLTWSYCGHSIRQLSIACSQRVN
jgi:hypothetical protein